MTHPHFLSPLTRILTLIEIIPLLSVYSASLRYIFPIKRLITGKVYPNPGHREGSVRTKPSPVCQHLGSVRSQSKEFLGLDLDWTGRFQSGLIHCWTGGIIATSLACPHRPRLPPWRGGGLGTGTRHWAPALAVGIELSFSIFHI